NLIGEKKVTDWYYYNCEHSSIAIVNNTLYLAYSLGVSGDYNVDITTVTLPLPPPPFKPPILLIIAGLLVFSGALIYKKKDEFMTSKRYRYFVLVIAGAVLILLAHHLTKTDDSYFGVVLGFLSVPYILLVGAFSRNARQSFIFGSFAYLCLSFGIILLHWEIWGFLFLLVLLIFCYPFFIAFSVATQNLMSWLKEKAKLKITKFKTVPNPYVAGIPIRDKEMFFGRKDVFDFLKQKFITGKTTTNVFLYGGRRIGKTSSLYQIKGGALGDKFIPVFVDLQGIGDMDTYGFFNFVTQEIRKTLEEKGIEMKEYAFGSAKESYTATFNRVLDDIPDLIKDKQMIFMFDETEIIEEMVRKGRFDSAIYSYCESIMQHRPKISCIFTSSPGALSKKREDKPLFRAASYKEISFLEKEDAIELIKKPVEGFDRYTDKVIERIRRITGSNPFYIQYICYELVNILNKEKRNNVRMKDIDSVIKGLIKGAPMHLGYVWDNVSYDEKIILSLLSEIIRNEDEFISVSAIEKYKNQQEKKGKKTIKLSERIEKILEDLQHEDILEKDLKDRYRYKVDLARYWVKEYYPVWRVVGEEEHESISE
ncbi:MAG: ATP-binding protein, partial [Deltaproteobacteria bacterium]|nr:ATP-binding protein [Deltaproteobacteria bacterium]